MKRTLTLFCILSFIFLKAQISPTYTVVCASTPCVLFTDQTPSAVAWLWNFGDPASGPNNTSTQQTVMHCYPGVGMYNVSCIVTLQNNQTQTWTSAVNIVPNPVAAFSSSNTGGNTVQFTDQSTGGVVVWMWDFGDASPTGYLQNPSHTYANSSTYNVNLVVVDTNGCMDTALAAVTATPNGIPTVPGASAFHFLPNPASDYVQIEIPGAAKAVAEIYSPAGQLLLRENSATHQSTIDVSSLPDGIYLLRIVSGENSSQQTLVITH